MVNKRDSAVSELNSQLSGKLDLSGQATIVAAGSVQVVKSQTHEEAIESAHEQGIIHFYRNGGRLFRCYRLGKEYIIVDHETRGYYVSDRLKAAMVNMQTNEVWAVLHILIKHKQIMRGWMECCLLSFHSYANSRATLAEMHRELKRFF